MSSLLHKKETDKAFPLPPEVTSTIREVAKRHQMTETSVIVAVISQWADEPRFRTAREAAS